MLQYSFPFCAVADVSNIPVTATITITCADTAPVTQTIELTTLTWETQAPAQSIIVEVNHGNILNKEVVFKLTADVSDHTVLFFQPYIVNNTIDFKLNSLSQVILGTEFKTTDMWYNLPLNNNEEALVGLELMKHYETLDDVAEFLRDKVEYQTSLTYKTREQNKPDLTLEENIEYYLGKDRYKNMFFRAKIPSAWDVPVRAVNPNKKPLANNIQYDTDKNIEYKFNNLGYRSNFDYNEEALLGKDIVLCLGDSDVFGAYIEFDSIWTTQLQNKLTDKVTVLNLGIRGLSADGVARIGTQTVEALRNNIVAVCVHWPPPSLREFVSKTFKCGVHTHRNYYLPYEGWWKHIDWQSNNYNYFKNQILLSSVCAKHGILYSELIANKEDQTVPYDLYEFGVYDAFGTATHTAIANYFYKKITGQPSLYQNTQS